MGKADNIVIKKIAQKKRPSETGGPVEEGESSNTRPSCNRPGNWPVRLNKRPESLGPRVEPERRQDSDLRWCHHQPTPISFDHLQKLLRLHIRPKAPSSPKVHNTRIRPPHDQSVIDSRINRARRRFASNHHPQIHGVAERAALSSERRFLAPSAITVVTRSQGALAEGGEVGKKSGKRGLGGRMEKQRRVVRRPETPHTSSSTEHHRVGYARVS
ncbi:hypothetical protein WN55_08915 [Dufourea novaeangliae]|uniref:Uncharacterized protein n=1 Tax=Dufourea novaeangliae TaxID=178035 RepID=A0A154P599_DUFNO|nr:hypothetical protein WN55_08915 [Dufourea novaeangliae]